jgi:mRNA-degrading endonuclease RelE of RelBE toxin-antitoxin system
VGTPRGRSLTDELLAVPPQDRRRLERDLEALRDNPRPPSAKQLSKDTYRIRRGNWRIIYRVFDADCVVLIGGIRRRGPHTYRRVEELFD